MSRSFLHHLGLCWVVIPAVLLGQASDAHSPHATGKPSNAPGPRWLQVVRKVRSASELATAFAPPLACDRDGNIYLMNEPFAMSGVRRLNPAGKRTALFLADQAFDAKLDASTYFALDPGRNLYQLANPHEATRYVVVFAPNGTPKSKIALRPGFAAPWEETALGVFANGSLLVTGLAYERGHLDAPTLPFTGVFDPQGELVREVHLEDDASIHEMGVLGDSRATTPEAPHTNLAVIGTRVERADDGNLYLMRPLTQATIYAISTGGAVLRRFTVDPGDANFQPSEMHVSGSRLAFTFRHAQTGDGILKITDLTGRVLETYSAPTKIDPDGNFQPTALDGSLACYSAEPESFTFLTKRDEDNKLEFNIVQPADTGAPEKSARGIGN